jgi:hypothetical protein
MAKVRERIQDYANLGVQTAWVIDPWRRIAYTAGPGAVLHPIEDTLTGPGTDISIEVSTIFAEVERHQKRAAGHPNQG